MAGRNMLKRHAVEDAQGNLPEEWKWLDEGESFLREQFKGTNLDFCASFARPGVVELIVWRRKTDSDIYRDTLERIFVIQEQVKYFVSEATLAKIIMVM